MLAFNIAKRFLTSNKSQMVLISLGIAIGVSVQIFIGSLIFGLQNSLIDKTVGSSPHITISPNNKGEYIYDYENIKIDNSTYSLTGNAYLNNTGVLVRGFSKNAFTMYSIEKRTTGLLPKTNEIIIGKKLMEEANLKIGDSYQIKTSDNELSLKIVGYFDLEVSSINETWIITNLETAQNLFKTNGITSVEIQINDVFKAREEANKLNYNYKITNWMDENEALLSGLNGQSISSYMIQIFVLVSVVLGIASVLIISVVQKRKQIGILKAMGIKDNTSGLIFIFQGLLLGVIGATLGVLFGIGLLYMFTTFAKNPDNTPVIPITINYLFIISSWFIAVLVSIVASIIPSISSKKLSPIEVIKNG